MTIKMSNYCKSQRIHEKKIIKRNLIIVSILIKMYTTVHSIDVISTKIIYFNDEIKIQKLSSLKIYPLLEHNKILCIANSHSDPLARKKKKIHSVFLLNFPYFLLLGWSMLLLLC